MDERYGWRAASPTGSGRRNVSPPRAGRQSVGRQSPLGHRQSEITRLTIAADIRAGEIARLTDKTERLGERLASARSRFVRGAAVRATAELTVRGVQAVAIGDTGVVFGPSDDLSLKNGVNVQWDMRRDGGNRRINVLQTDIVPLDSSPRHDLPSSPVPLHRYSRSPGRDEYHSPTRPSYTSFSPPPPTTKPLVSSLSPTKYIPHTPRSAHVAHSDALLSAKRIEDERRMEHTISPTYVAPDIRAAVLRSPRGDYADHTRTAMTESVGSPSAVLLANEVSELHRKRLDEEQRLHNREHEVSELQLKLIEEERRLQNHEHQLSQLEQKRLDEERKLQTSEEEVSHLQRKRIEEERLLQSNEMVISELQQKRLEEERLLFSTSSALRSEEQRLQLLTQRIRDEENRLTRLQAASVSPPHFDEAARSIPAVNNFDCAPVSPPKFPPAVPAPRAGSSPTSSHGCGKSVSSPPSERVVRQRSSLSSHARDTHTPDNVLSELRMEDSVRVEPSPNPLPKRESASRHITFNGDQVIDQQQLDSLQGEWMDARGTWVIRGTIAESLQRGVRETYRITSDGMGNVCLDRSSLSRTANGGKTLIWSDGDIWNRSQVGVGVDCDSESTASLQLMNTMRDDDHPCPVRMSMSRKSSIRGFERGASTDRSLLARKGSLGRILAHLAEERGSESEPEIDDENVWWQVPVIDCSSVTFTHPLYGDRPPGATSAPNTGSFIRFEVGSGGKFIYTVDGDVQPPVSAITLERTEHGVFLLFPDEKDDVMPERVVCLPPEDINDLVASTISVCKKTGVFQNLNYEYEALANQEVIVERFLASNGEDVPWNFVDKLLPPNYLMEPTSNASVAAAMLVAGMAVAEKQKDGRYCTIM